MIDLGSALHANEQIVPQLYAAVADSAGWDDALAGLADFVVGGFGSLTRVCLDSGKREVMAAAGFSSEQRRHWEGMIGVCPWTRLGAATALGSVVRAGAIVPFADRDDLPVVRDILKPNGLRDALGVRLSDSPSMVTMFSSFAPEPYGPEAQERLGYVTPHLACAVALHQRSTGLQAEAEARSSELDSLASGVLLLRADGSILHANARAQKMLDEADGLGVAGEKLRLVRPEDRQALVEAIDQQRSPRPDQPRRSFFRIGRCSGARPYHAAVSPVVPAFADVATDCAVLLWLSDPDAPVAPAEDALRVLLGLTPAEARLTAAVARGQSLKGYAAASGLAESTARWTMKQVLQKTDTHSQVELVRLVLQSVPTPVF